MANPVYRIVGAFDTETSNIHDFINGYRAFPCLYQYATIKTSVMSITPENVEADTDVMIARHDRDIAPWFDSEIEKSKGRYVPVVMVHNLGFDMYALSDYLLSHDVKVLAKTSVKPISFQILDQDGKPALVFLDTLGLFMKSLAKLGEECGMPKAVGLWDYDRVRTPDTPITADELQYAVHDLYALICYMGYFLRQNPDVKECDVGFKVQTKTGIVRAKRMLHLGNVKGSGQKLKVRQYWHLLNKSESPKTDDELFTMHASTRGGFTFCASKCASVPFEAGDGIRLLSYDATSQHPAQMVSHLYPQNFKNASLEQLEAICENVVSVRIEQVMKSWFKPFSYAFYAAFEFENLRPKSGTVFEKNGIYSLASARLSGYAPVYDNQSNAAFKDAIGAKGYKDSATNPVYAYGKLVSAERAVLYLTELDLWIMSRIYEWDSVTPIHGYISSKFRKPTDLSILSVMRFYAAKDSMKEFMHEYVPGRENSVAKIKGYYPDVLVEACKAGNATVDDLKSAYALSKADLNALFGIEAMNEARRDFELTEDGLILTGVDGLDNMPKTPKTFYQFGQRIVGWSRVAQTVVMERMAPHVDSIICGDTDSLKVAVDAGNVAAVEAELRAFGKCLNASKKYVCGRVKRAYRSLYDSLEGVGHYVFDGEYEALCASWNKSYITKSGGKHHATIAGIPSGKRSDLYGSLNDYCDDLGVQGYTFEDICNIVLGYNTSISPTVTKLNARVHPEKFGSRIRESVVDYLGNTHYVDAPAALALHPGLKTLGDTRISENYINSQIASSNNPDVMIEPRLLTWDSGRATIERF